MALDEGTLESSHHKIYYHRYSICSLMVRYMLALRGHPKPSSSDILVDLHEVDIFHGAQLEEHFLLDINPKGQVPVLVAPGAQAAPIPESVEITLYHAETYPNLLPNDQVLPFLRELHSVNFFSLSFAGRARTAKDVVLQRLARDDISDRYRKALEYKLTVLEKEKIGAVEPSEVSANEDRAKRLLSKLDALVIDSKSQWLFGEQPSALDAHLIPFVARMRDVGRASLIPPALGAYADRAIRGEEWTKLMAGRTTLPIVPS